MAGTLKGRRAWSLSRAREGIREYKIVHLVVCDDGENDGPATALNTPGIPLPGASWNFGNDVDNWAFCKNDATVTLHEHKEGERHSWWKVEQTFSTNPNVRCQDAQIENPLMEPQQISGGFIQEFREITHDWRGKILQNSAHEQLRGQLVEFEFNRPTVRISQNVPNLQLPLLCESINRVNGNPMWGLPKRCIKLSSISWERKYYGTCFPYYTRTFEFDANFETFDRVSIDVGTKVLSGKWDHATGNWVLVPINHYGPGGVVEATEEPDYRNPTHFIAYTDRHGRPGRVVLNGAGHPANTTIVLLDNTEIPDELGEDPDDFGTPGKIPIRWYKEQNFFLLNVPPMIG
jgi:hypothetical protein